MNERTHEISPSPKKPVQSNEAFSERNTSCVWLFPVYLPSSFLTFHLLVATKLPQKGAVLGIQSCSEGHFKLGTILSQCATLSSQSTSRDFTWKMRDYFQSQLRRFQDWVALKMWWQKKSFCLYACGYKSLLFVQCIRCPIDYRVRP
jgi:hypothetical protein